MAALGFSDSHGGSVSLGLHHVRIADIGLGAQSHATVAATFSAGSLLHGRLQTIAVSGVELHGAATLDGRLTLDGFAPPNSQQGPAGPIDLPADRVEISGAVLVLDTLAGPSRITADGTLTGADGGLRLTGTVVIAAEPFSGNTPVDFTLTPGGWSLSMNPIAVAFTGKERRRQCGRGPCDPGRRAGRDDR